MALLEIKVEFHSTALSFIEELLGETERQDYMILEDKPSGRAWLVGYFEARDDAEKSWRDLVRHIEPTLLVTEPVFEELPDRDWKESYKVHFKPWRFGRLHWVPVWERTGYEIPEGDQVLWLDPGMAFGTGNHETTRLVVERLVALRERPGSDRRVIDAGCGSGILALSAIALGYSQVAAFDNDPLAIDVSRQNAAMNALDGRIEFFVGDLSTGLRGRKAEMVMANIQADVLRLYAIELVTAVAPGGSLVMSGILASELNWVRDRFAEIAPGWLIDSRTMGEWSDLVLSRPRG